MAVDNKKASGSGSAPDMELKKAFTELQFKMVESRQKMKLADMQIENLKRSIIHAGLTEGEISSLPEGTRVYKSVGRMFMISSQSGIKDTLEGKKKTCGEKIKNLESSKEYLERNLKDSENSLRELILQKKGAPNVS